MLCYISQESLAATWDGIYYAMLVYDVSSQESFESCKEWLEELKKARWAMFLLLASKRLFQTAKVSDSGTVNCPIFTLFCIHALSSVFLVCRPDKERPLKAVLVATKNDLPPQRFQVSNDVAQVWANANGMEFFAASSVRSYSVVDCLKHAQLAECRRHALAGCQIRPPSLQSDIPGNLLSISMITSQS
jgi:hypothetical protein